MTYPCPDDRNAENPFAYYEDKPLQRPPVDWSAAKNRDESDEEPAAQEPRTPFSMALYYPRSGKYYDLKVRRASCRLYDKDGNEPLLTVARNEAEQRIAFQKSHLILHGEDGSEYSLRYNLGQTAELQLARLAAWRERPWEDDPIGAYQFIRDKLVRDAVRYVADKFVLLSAIVIAVQLLFLLIAVVPMYAMTVQREAATVAMYFAPVTVFVLGLTVALKCGKREALPVAVWTVQIPMGLLLLLSPLLPGLLVLFLILFVFPFLIVSRYHMHKSQLRQLKSDNADLFM